MKKPAFPHRFVTCPRAELVAPLGPRAFRARLENGHELTAVLSRDRAAWAEGLQSGDAVTLLISPADFTQARITGRAEFFPVENPPPAG